MAKNKRTLTREKQSLFAGFDTQEDGVIAKLLVANGTQDIKVGQPLLIMVDSEDDVSAFADYLPDGGGAGAPASAGGADGASAGARAAEGKSGGISGAAGGTSDGSKSVKRSDRLGPAARFALNTHGLSVDDITPTGPNGIVTKGDVMAAVASGVKGSAKKSEKEQAGVSAAAAGQRDTAAKAQTGVDQKKQGKEQVQTSSSSSSSSSGGVSGRVRKGTERYKDIPVSGMRRTIAKRLLESKLTTPAIYVSADAKLDALTTLRGALKSAGVKASVNDFVLKACALALRAVPGACAGWDTKQEAAKQFENVDISVAVATEGGLITPIVKGADGKSIQAISKAVKDLAGARASAACRWQSFTRALASWRGDNTSHVTLHTLRSLHMCRPTICLFGCLFRRPNAEFVFVAGAGRARENKLKPEEYTGGSFTISNLGMFGINEFSAIINPPQACILAIGGTQQRYRVQEPGRALAAESYMTVTLSADNRVVDEETAAEFLQSFAFHIENPALLMA